MKHNQTDLSNAPHNQFDAVVNGGGLAGLACAVNLARQGARVALVERRGAFGWEIGRSRRIFVDLSRATRYSHLMTEWHDTLMRWGGSKEAYVDPAYSELIFDQWIVESGVQPFLHTWAVDVYDSGLIVGTKEGYRQLHAPFVIETDDPGRLIPEERKMAEPNPVVTKTFMMAGADLRDETMLAVSTPTGKISLHCRPVAPHSVQVDVIFHKERNGMRQTTPSVHWRELVVTLRQQCPELQDTAVAFIGDDEWAHPGFRVKGHAQVMPDRTIGTLLTMDDGKTLARPFTESQLPVEKGPVTRVFAGPWIDGVRACSESEEAAVLNRLLVGEAAARYVQNELTAIEGIAPVYDGERFQAMPG